MGRICITLPDAIEAKITTEADAQHVTKSDWISAAVDHYLRTRDQDCEKVREEWQALRIAYATLQGEHKGQAAMIEELHARAVHAEGLISSMMAERQALIPERPRSFWDRLFGRG